MSSLVSYVLGVPAKILGVDDFSQYSLLIVLGALILFGLLFTSSSSTTLKQRQVAKKPIVPTLQPKTVLPAKISPKITKLEKAAPVMNPKSYEEALKEVPIEEIVVPEVLEVLPVEVEVLEVLAPIQEVMEEIQVEEAHLEVEEVVPPPAEPSALPTMNEVDSTFEAYRQAMLASGPRQMENEMRNEILQTKSHGYRHQNLALRHKLNMSTAEFLESNNTSINDRMVAMFDSI